MILENFKKNCYYSDWNLKPVTNGIFLSSECNWVNNKWEIKWANKNREYVQKEKKQKIFRFLHENPLQHNMSNKTWSTHKR